MSRLREVMSPEQRVAILRDRKFELDEVRYPRRPVVGPHVCIDGRPYAAFVDGKHVRTRPMTPLERQGRLDFDVDPPRGSSGKVADAPAKPEEPKPTPDPAVDQAAESPDAIAAEMARVMKGPIDIAKGLVERFGIEGATRVIDAIRGGMSAEEAFAQEDARRGDAKPGGEAKPKKGKPKKKGNGKGSLRDALDGPEAEG